MERIRGVAGICREEGVPCLANGDVEDYQDAQRVMREFHVDGAMIARAAESNPSCFRPEGKLPSIDIAREFLEKVLMFHNLSNDRLSKLIIICLIRNTVSRGFWQIEEKNLSIDWSRKQKLLRTSAMC